MNTGEDSNTERFQKLIVLSKSESREFVHDKPWACISIGSEPEDWPKINKCQLVDILQLAFEDMNSETEGHILFNEEHAKQIWDFVDRVWDEIDILVVHCFAGISRSPAVAAAISNVKYGNDFFFFKNYCPNSHVYSVLLKVWHERILSSREKE